MTPAEPKIQSTQTALVSGYRAALFSHSVRLACKIAGVLVLTRLVSPADHGLFALAASLTLLLSLFRDLGMSVAAVQAPELSEGQKTALWWLHLALGAVLMLLTLALAPLVARFFHETRLVPLLAVMSLGFLLNGANAWPRTLLNRDLRFAEVNRLETAGAIAGTAAMIAGGALGAGAYSFVAFLLVSEAVMLAFVWRLAHWRRRDPADWPGLGPIARTGLHLTAYNLLVYGLQQTDTVLMGRWFGAAPLGFYNRAGQLLLQPVTHMATPFSNVLVAGLARLGPASPDFVRQFREGTNAIAHLGLPLAVACMVIPDEIVWLVLGRNWPNAAPLLVWLAASVATVILTTSLYALCVTTGHASRLVQLTAVALAVTILGLTIGRSWGPVGIAAGLAIANLILLLPRVYWSIRGTPVRWRDFADACVGPAGIAIVFALALFGGRTLAQDGAIALRLIAALGCGLAAVAACIALWPRARSEFIRIVAYVRSSAHRPTEEPIPAAP